mgnify:FL=1
MGTSRARRPPCRGPRKDLYIVGAIGAVGGVLGLVIIGALARDGGNSPTGAVVVPTERPALVEQQGRTLGDPAAAVTVVEYLDFQCPFCGRAASLVMPAIEEQFIETGIAKLEIRPIAIIGSESVRAAAAAECAKDQGRFFAFHDILFANQAGEQEGAFNDSRLKEFAAAIGLDMSAFNSCFDSSTYDEQVAADTAAARDAGIRVTPTVLVDGVNVEPTVEAISAAIAQASNS